MIKIGNTNQPIRRTAAMSSKPTNITKGVLLSVTVMYILTTTFINLPLLEVVRFIELSGKKAGPKTAATLKQVDYQWRKVAHIIGWDSVWRMFSKQEKEFWTLHTIGNYKSGNNDIWIEIGPDGERYSMTIGIQVLDPIYQAVSRILDEDESTRQPYADYLSRRFAYFENRPIQEIGFILKEQKIRPQTSQKGDILETKKEESMILKLSPTKKVAP
jgi:hypothetical protein